jgi:hypothetical protein
MMATTHAAMGAALAVPLLWVAPELAPVAALAAMAGGVFPDLDTPRAHRRTLHYPALYWVPAFPAVAAAAVAPVPVTVAVAAFLVSAAVHSGVDALGGGLGLRPWEGEDDRGVYLHVTGEWLRPRRWVSYDGSPGDLAAAAAFALPVAAAFGGAVRALALAGLVVSAAYVAVRKRIPEWTPGRFK